MKHLRGHLDIYVRHLGGVDKVIVRSWPVKGKGYQSDSFIKNRNAATIVILTYRQLSQRIKKICKWFHRGLNDTFLDHFRAGLQSDAYLLQATPPFFSDFEMSDAINPPLISIRFFRTFDNDIIFDDSHGIRLEYAEEFLVRKRGTVCSQHYYTRPKAYKRDKIQHGLAGWSAWIDFLPNKEISVYSSEPGPNNLKKPWFGPYPISILYAQYLLFN